MITERTDAADLLGCATFEYHLNREGQRRFLQWSDAALILQLRSDEVLTDGRAFTERIHAADRRRLERAEAALLLEEDVMSLRLRLSVDHRFHTILLRGRVRERSGDAIVVGGFIVDLSWSDNQRTHTHLSRVDDHHILKSLQALFEQERVHLDEDLSLEELARRLRLSTHQMSEFLNRRLGLSYAELVNRYRVAEACRLLRERGELSLIEICYEAGFRSKGAFHTAFRQITGTTPLRFRQVATQSTPAPPLIQPSFISLYKARRQPIANLIS